MAIQLYSDRQVVLARLKAINLRNEAWDKAIRTYSAKRLTTWWKRMLKRKAVIELQWKADLQQFRVRKAKFHPAAANINSLCRVWLAHPWLVYMVHGRDAARHPENRLESRPAILVQQSDGGVCVGATNGVVTAA
jgi:hypothetical protein